MVNRFTHMFLSFEHFVIIPNEEDLALMSPQQQDSPQNFDKISFLSDQVSKIVLLCTYNERLKSECLDFGIFRFGSIIIKQFRFRTVSEIRTKSLRFQMFSLAQILWPN